MKLNRIGIILIACALAAITLVVALLVVRQQASQAAQVRNKGVGLVKALSTVPMTLLADSSGRGGVLAAVLASHDGSDFAYVTIGDANGRTLAEIAGSGSIAPATPLPADAQAGFGERTLPATGGSAPLREFYGPLADASGGRRTSAWASTSRALRCWRRMCRSLRYWR